ncbi:MAG: Rieske (2Fe-2S) protein [Haloarculaceae archaeon]
MPERTRLTTVETVAERGSWLCTVRDPHGLEEEVILVPCEDDDPGDDGGSGTAGDGVGVEAWVNRCTHEAQRLDRGFGAALRDGEIVCPKHGSMFDACSGECDNGEAAGTTLVGVDVTVADGAVYLVDRRYEFDHEGGIDDGGGDDESDDGSGPSSTSHIGF